MSDRAAAGRERGVAEVVTSFVNTQLLPQSGAAVSDDALLSDLIDSVGLMELLSFLEAEFAIVLDPYDIHEENLASIRRIVRLIERKTNR